MEIQFIAGFAVIAPEPAESRKLYVDALGLPLEQADGDYFAQREGSGGSQALRRLAAGPRGPGVLRHPRRGRATGPSHRRRVEFEVAESARGRGGGGRAGGAGLRALHPPRTEPWGQTVARILTREGLIVGISHAPWHHKG